MKKATVTKSKDHAPPEVAKESESKLVAEAAKRAIEKAGNDMEAAIATFERSVRSNVKLREAVLEPLVHEACYAVISRHFRIERRAIWKNSQQDSRAPAVDADGQVDRVVHLATGTLLMFPLPGGMRLGDAKREEIEAAARFYHAQVNDMAVKARWLDLVAKQVPDGKKAGEVLNDEQLQQLQREASET